MSTCCKFPAESSTDLATGNRPDAEVHLLYRESGEFAHDPVCLHISHMCYLQNTISRYIISSWIGNILQVTRYVPRCSGNDTANIGLHAPSLFANSFSFRRLAWTPEPDHLYVDFEESMHDFRSQTDRRYIIHGLRQGVDRWDMLDRESEADPSRQRA